MDIYNTDLEWISSGEAARILHVSTQTVRDWTDQGKLRAKLTTGGHRQYDAYEIRRVALEERGIHHYWSADAVIQLHGDGRVTTFGEEQDGSSSSLTKVPLRSKYGNDLRMRSDLVNEGVTKIHEPQVVETVVEHGELIAQTYLAINAFDKDEAARLLEEHLPSAVTWLRTNAIPVQGVAKWVSPAGKRYKSAY